MASTHIRDVLLRVRQPIGSMVSSPRCFKSSLLHLFQLKFLKSLGSSDWCGEGYILCFFPSAVVQSSVKQTNVINGNPSLRCGLGLSQVGTRTQRDLLLR